ncbi:hypothetical protein ACX3U9_05750 [Corynebacterium pyruviciproducens]
MGQVMRISIALPFPRKRRRLAKSDKPWWDFPRGRWNLPHGPANRRNTPGDRRP